MLLSQNTFKSLQINVIQTVISLNDLVRVSISVWQTCVKFTYTSFLHKVSNDPRPQTHHPLPISCYVFSQTGDMSHQPSVFASHTPDSLTAHFQNKTKMRQSGGTRSSAFALQSGLHQLARQDKDRDSGTDVKVPVWDSTVSATYAWKDGQRPKGVEKKLAEPASLSASRSKSFSATSYMCYRLLPERQRDVVHMGWACAAKLCHRVSAMYFFIATEVI